MAKLTRTPPPPRKGMQKQRDRGGHNAHGHQHPQHLGRLICGEDLVKEAPKLPRAGLTPQKRVTRP